MSRAPLVGSLIRTLGKGFLPGGRQGALSILLFHSIGRKFGDWSDGISEAEFDRVIQFVAANFSVLPLSEAIARLQNRSLPPRSVAITFDDGYLDNLDIALPILVDNDLSATFFIATGTLDGGMMWNDKVLESIRGARDDRIDLSAIDLGVLDLGSQALRSEAFRHCISKLKYLDLDTRESAVDHLADIAGVTLSDRVMMSRDDVARMDRSGMTIGAHTVRHPILESVADDVAYREIERSKRELSEIIGREVSLFAYPNGRPGQDFSRRHVEMAKELGFTAAVSTTPGVSRWDVDLFQLPRFTPWDTKELRFGLRMLRNAHTKSSFV